MNWDTLTDAIDRACRRPGARGCRAGRGELVETLLGAREARRRGALREASGIDTEGRAAEGYDLGGAGREGESLDKALARLARAIRSARDEKSRAAAHRAFEEVLARFGGRDVQESLARRRRKADGGDLSRFAKGRSLFEGLDAPQEGGGYDPPMPVDEQEAAYLASKLLALVRQSLAGEASRQAVHLELDRLLDLAGAPGPADEDEPDEADVAESYNRRRGNPTRCPKNTKELLECILRRR